MFIWMCWCVTHLDVHKEGVCDVTHEGHTSVNVIWSRLSQVIRTGQGRANLNEDPVDVARADLGLCKPINVKIMFYRDSSLIGFL